MQLILRQRCLPVENHHCYNLYYSCLPYLELGPEGAGVGQPVQQVSLEKVQADLYGLVLAPAVVLPVLHLFLTDVQQVILVNVIDLSSQKDG